jgi:hypothetical protein
MNTIAHMVQAIGAKPAVYAKRAKVPPVTQRVREVAEFVRATPGCSREAVALAFKCAARTAGIHLQAAKLNGLVRCDHMGRFSRWWPVEAA